MNNKKPGLIDRTVSWGIDRYAHARNQWITKVQPTESRHLLSTLLGGGRNSIIEGGGLSNNPADTQEKQRQSLATSWIYADIQLIAREFSAASISVKRIDGERLVDVPNHPFELLLARPNDQIDLTFLWQYTIAWLQLRGDGFWYMAPEAGNPNAIAEIWPIQADRMTPALDPNGQEFVAKWLYRTNAGSAIRIDPRYVVHFMLPNPYSLYKGLSPLFAGLLAMDTEKGTGEFQKDYYLSGRGIPASVLMLNEDMGDRDFDATVAQIREDFEEERKVVITRGGDLKVATVGLSQREMQIVNQREFTRDEIDTIYLGLALHRKSTQTELLQMDKMFKEKTIHPLHTLLGGQLNVQVMQRFYTPQEVVAFEDIRAQDKALNVQERNVYWRAKTLNEARQDLGLPPYDDSALGDILVPLATDPAYVAMLQGISRTGTTPGSDGGLLPKPQRREPSANASMSESDAPVNQMADTAMGKGLTLDDVTPMKHGEVVISEDAIHEARSVELGRWKKVALKEVRAGRNPGAKVFTSSIIPRSMGYEIRGALLEVERTEDAVKALFETFKADTRGGGRGRPSAEITAVNKYQKSLEDEYAGWADDTADKLAKAKSDDERNSIITAVVLVLINLLKELGRKEIPQAMFLAIGDISPSPELIKHLSDSLVENENYLQGLGQAITTKLARAFADPDIQLALQAGEGYDALRATLEVLKSRVAMYAGAWWAEYQYAFGTVGDTLGKEYRWNLDPLVRTHCGDCLEYGDTTYPSFADMLLKSGGKRPGYLVACGSNCRCGGEYI